MVDQTRGEPPADGSPPGRPEPPRDGGPTPTGGPEHGGRPRPAGNPDQTEPHDLPHPAAGEAGGHDPWAGGADTSILPPTGAARPHDRDRWTARAGVPPAEQAAAEVWVEPPEPVADRRWWAPALVALLALLLLAVLVLGIWLIVRSQDSGAPAPVPSGSATPSRQVTSAPPTSAPPSPSPSVPVRVVVPDTIIGLPVADAQRLLGELGVLSQVQRRPDAGAPAGTVVGCVPTPGSTVPVGGTVTLIVAVPPPPSPAASPTTAGPSPSG